MCKIDQITVTIEEEYQRNEILIQYMLHLLVDQFSHIYTEVELQEYIDNILDDIDVSQYIGMYYDTKECKLIPETLEDIKMYMNDPLRIKYNK
jgi:hypothetical protein